MSGPDVDVRPWQFLIAPSTVSLGTMTLFASPTMATSTPQPGLSPIVPRRGGGHGIALVPIFVWIGLVAAISFLEATLGGFRAALGEPRMWPRLGGRVFATARTGEVVAAVTLTIAVAGDPPPLSGIVAVAIAVVSLAFEM